MGMDSAISSSCAISLKSNRMDCSFSDDSYDDDHMDNTVLPMTIQNNLVDNIPSKRLSCRFPYMSSVGASFRSHNVDSMVKKDREILLGITQSQD